VSNIGSLVVKDPVFIVTTEKMQLKQYESTNELTKHIDATQDELVTEIQAHSATKVQKATVEALLNGRTICETETSILTKNLEKECESKVRVEHEKVRAEHERGIRAKANLKDAYNSDIANLKAECRSETAKLEVEYSSDIAKLRASCNKEIKIEALGYCNQVESKIDVVQNILKGELCDSNPPLCLKELKRILPLPEGNYPESSSVWEKIRKIFKK
jgi:hypothetical protein